MPSPFQNRSPHIDGNQQLRDPQREAYRHLAEFAREITDEREVGIVLPVGCGKSGTIAINAWSSRYSKGQLTEEALRNHAYSSRNVKAVTVRQECSEAL